MTSRFDLVTFDSPDPDRLARFWSAALHLVEIERENEGRWIVLGEHDGTRRIGIQRGTRRAGSIHLDLACETSSFDVDVDRLVSLGACVVQPARAEPYGRIANLADPDGNPFDLCAYA